jgi:hypothetical protein
MKKLLFCSLLVSCTLLQAQVTYTVSKTTVLSSSAEVITVQQPSSNALVVRGISAYIDSTAACAFTIERDGTPATSTALTPVPLNPLISSSAASTGWSSSNVGTGSVVTRAATPAGGSVVVDLTRLVMNGNGTFKNFTLRTASCTATVNVVLTYTEATN